VTSDSLLHAVWQRDADDLHCLSQARHAFRLAADAITAQHDRAAILWLPDYFCEEALTMARRRGAQIVFYPVTRDLAPDWAACRELSARQRPDLFVVVHYFGREADTRVARAFCDEVGALLFEDASHVLRPAGDFGRHGDLICYSPRKFFPIPDGGLLVVRGTELARRLRETARGLPPRRAPARAWVLKQWRRAVKGRLRLTRLKPRRPLPPTTLDVEITIGDAVEQIWMSGYSRWRVARMVKTGEIERFGNARVGVHHQLAERLQAETDMQPLCVPDGLVPIATMMRCDSERSAARYLNEMRAIGARVYTWLQLPPEVKADPQRHGEALRLHRTLLCFTHEWTGGGRPTDFLAALPLPKRPPA
jgi:hypothetical protein